MLQLTEKPADGLVVLGYTKFKKFAALFEDLDLIKVARHEMEDSKAVMLRSEELDKVGKTHLTLLIKMSFKEDIRS